jgi:hypothetical protein
MGTTNSSDRIVFLRDMVCLRNICVNTLHKGDSIFTNNNNNNNNVSQHVNAEKCDYVNNNNHTAQTLHVNHAK